MAIDSARVSIETITPAKARYYLNLNTSNRPVADRTVEQYADDLRHGRWKFNGDTIRVSATRLLDGQHRLLAILATGISLTSIVVTGLDEEVFETIDSGRKRSGADVLSISGESNAAIIAAALRQIWLYRNHQIINQEENFSNSLVLQELQSHPGIRSSARYITSFRNTRLLSCATAAAYHYLFSHLNPDAANAFFKGLYTGEMLHSASALYHLHHRFLDALTASSNNSSNNRSMRQPARIALLIKAFNNYIVDRPTRTLRWSTNERFPDIVGLPPEAVDGIASARALHPQMAT